MMLICWSGHYFLKMVDMIIRLTISNYLVIERFITYSTKYCIGVL